MDNWFSKNQKFSNIKKKNQKLDLPFAALTSYVKWTINHPDSTKQVPNYSTNHGSVKLSGRITKDWWKTNIKHLLVQLKT